MDERDIEQEARVLVKNMMGGRSHKEIEGMMRMLESIIGMCVENDGQIDEDDLKLLQDYMFSLISSSGMYEDYYY